MDNYQTQSQVAYEVGPKEVNTHRGMPKSKQFGKEKMPQDEKKKATKEYVKKEVKHELAEHNKKYHHGEKPYHARHKEHR